MICPEDQGSICQESRRFSDLYNGHRLFLKHTSGKYRTQNFVVLHWIKKQAKGRKMFTSCPDAKGLVWKNF